MGFCRLPDNFTGIKVTSDKDWSAKYPAGSPLNDKMGVRYVSYAEYLCFSERKVHFLSEVDKKSRKKQLEMYIFALNLTCMEQINTIDKISAVYRNTAEEARQELNKVQHEAEYIYHCQSSHISYEPYNKF